MNLPDKISIKFEEALNSGALQSYITEERIVRNDIDFVVFVLKQPDVKGKSFWKTRETVRVKDPFMPYEKDLFIDDINGTHICLLNKYNVIKDHILIVTRSFEDQEAPLTKYDFEALCVCMENIDGLAFYNSGRKAGASQRHKHLQLIKLPLSGKMEKLPVEELISGLDNNKGPQSIMRFDFRHGLYFLPGKSNADCMLEKYIKLLEYTGLAGNWGPYNLLVTRGWMMLIPRILESYRGISVNSLGFAGTLLVKDTKEYGKIERAGLFKVLSAVSQKY